MAAGALGRTYEDGEVIVRQGNPGDCMYVIQSGRVEVVRQSEQQEVRLAVLEENDFFGEVPLFEREVRSATVRAMGQVRVLTVDRKTLLRRITEDPTLAYRILETLSRRVRKLDAEVTKLRISRGDGG